MRDERFAIYCFSEDKICLAPVRYSEGTGQTIGSLLYMGAWVQKVMVDSGGAGPSTFPAIPPDFRPMVLSYSDFKEVGPGESIDGCADNLFVVLMPGYIPVNKQVLQLKIEAKYTGHLRANNIATVRTEKTEDIIDVKPNICGIGINFNAVFRRIGESLKRLRTPIQDFLKWFKSMHHPKK